MTLSASFSPQDNFPVQFSLGALFGFRKDSQPLWRYEPPSLRPGTEPLDLRMFQNRRTRLRHALTIVATQRMSLSTPHVEPEPTESIAFPKNHHRNSVSYSFTPSVPYTPGRIDKSITKDRLGPKESILETDHIDFNAHFEDFKARIAHAGDLCGGDRNKILAEAWRAHCPDHADAWIYNVAVVQHLTERNWDPVRIFTRLKYFALPPIYTAESKILSTCLQKLLLAFPHSSRFYGRVYLKLAEAAAGAEASTGPLQDLELLELVRHSLQSARSRSTDVQQCVANALAVVASKIKDTHTRGPLYSILTDINSTEHHVTFLLVCATKNKTLCVALEQVLFCLPREHLRSLVPSITLDLIKTIKRRSRLPQDPYRDRLTVWLAVLLNLDTRLRSTMSDATHLDIAVTQVAEHVFSNWKWSEARPQVLLHALIFKLIQQEPSYACYKERLLQVIYHSDVSETGSHGPVRLETTLGSIFSKMGRESLPCTPLVSMAINFFAHHASLDSVYRLLTALNQQGLKFDATLKVQSLLSERLVHLQQQPKPSTTKRRQHYAFALRICQNTLDLLEGLTPSSESSFVLEKDMVLALQARRQFQEILDRANEHHALPQVYHNITSNAPLEQRAIIIHQLAHHYSLNNTRTHRETWRAIFYLHKYLQAHSLPIGPLFTKAVVRVSIIRPLMEHRFISAKRLIWVCQLVAKVEGEDSAKKIESYFWRWRGDILKHAKTVHVGVGGDTKAKTLISHMKRLDMT
jgi:hypothetical protein